MGEPALQCGRHLQAIRAIGIQHFRPNQNPPLPSKTSGGLPDALEPLEILLFQSFQCFQPLAPVDKTSGGDTVTAACFTFEAGKPVYSCAGAVPSFTARTLYFTVVEVLPVAISGSVSAQYQYTPSPFTKPAAVNSSAVSGVKASTS